MKKITVKLSDMREEVFVGDFIEIEDGFLHFKNGEDVVGSVRESLVDVVRMEEMENN